MDTFLIILISSQCQGDATCVNYMENCTRSEIIHTPTLNQNPNWAERDKLAMSLCEKKYTNDEGFE